MSEEGRERQKTLTDSRGTIPFIAALIVLAKKGNLRAMQKLKEIEAWLKSLVENF